MGEGKKFHTQLGGFVHVLFLQIMWIFLMPSCLLLKIDFTSSCPDLLQVTRVVREVTCMHVVIEIVVSFGEERKFAIYCRLGCSFGRRRNDFSVFEAESSGSHT